MGPIWGLREKLVSDNILLVGDSAGMADPITGAGEKNENGCLFRKP